MNELIFNRTLLKNKKNILQHTMLEENFILKEVGTRLCERLDEIKQPFKQTLVLGSNLGEVGTILQQQYQLDNIIQTDLSLNFLEHNVLNSPKIVMDEENLAFQENSFDLIISVFNLQNTNNLQATIQQIYSILQPKSPFLMAIPVNGTLKELGWAIYNTELELYNGISNRIHPFSDIKTIANLMHNAQFIDITADSDLLTVMYKDISQLFIDLKKFGANNILYNQNPKRLSKEFITQTKHKLRSLTDQETNCVPISIEFVNLIGWKQ